MAAERDGWSWWWSSPLPSGLDLIDGHPQHPTRPLVLLELEGGVQAEVHRDAVAQGVDDGRPHRLLGDPELLGGDGTDRRVLEHQLAAGEVGRPPVIAGLDLGLERP